MKYFKINKKQYPKTARSLSFLGFIVTPVFTIGNRLWTLTGVFFGVVLGFNIALRFFQIFRDSISFIIYVVFYLFYLTILIYILLYGRPLAWQRTEFKDTLDNIKKFQHHQRILLFISCNFISIFSLIFYFFVVKYVIDLSF